MARLERPCFARLRALHLFDERERNACDLYRDPPPVRCGCNDLRAGHPLVPVRSSYVARWSATQDLDPNRGLQIAASPPELAVPAGPSSSEAEVTLTASGADGATVTWYERKSDGQFVARGTGQTWKTKQRVKAGDEVTLYVTATRDGVEGGKQAIRLTVRSR